VTMQAAARGFLCRRTQRSPSCQPAHCLRASAAGTLQSFYRQHLRRPRTARRIHRAARVIVSFLSCVPAIRKVRELQCQISQCVSAQAAQHAALVIQVWTRAQVARATTRQLREARNNEFQQVREAEAIAVIARFFRRSVARLGYLRRRGSRSEL
jgi:hypothetical protein